MIRTWALVAVLLGVASPGFSAQKVSVAELERILAESSSLPDGALAGQLADLQLTERFSSAKLERWRVGLTGAKSQRALLGLADRSAFLKLPTAEIPAMA
ncbi:MAG TPA: hypothetical protein VFD98_15690, partial [Terracidiphilus sp.]|nr:hypothetical protein [Terracidiphilus sp.]